jgi:hypothetical protein
MRQRPQGGLDTTAASGTFGARGRRLSAAPVCAADEPARSVMLARAARRAPRRASPRLSPALTPGQRRRKRRLDPVRLNSAAQCRCKCRCTGCRCT